MGNLTRDIELRYTPKGTPVGDSSIALNRKWTGEDGEKHDEVSFIEFTAFGKTAETLAQYFKKGSMIHLQGYMKMEQWEDKQTGVKRSKLKMIVERFCFTGQVADKNDPDQAERPARASTRSARPAPTPKIDDDDCPF